MSPHPGGRAAAKLEQRKDSCGSAYRLDLRHGAFGPLRNRRSCIKEHIRPGLGTVLMAKLDRPKVRPFLTGLTVFVAKGKPRRRAARHTVDAVHDTRNDIWKVHDEDRSAPWAGMRIKPPSDHADRVHAIRSGRVGAGQQLRKGYTPDEVKRALVAATWYDRHATE